MGPKKGKKKHIIGVLQGRLTPSNGRGRQFFPTENWQNEFALARDIGFDHIELLVKKDGYTENPLFTEAGRKEILEYQKKHGITTPSVHGFFGTENDYPATLIDLLRHGKVVGANTVLVSFSHGFTIDGPEKKALAITQLTAPIKEAERLGMRIGIETETFAPELAAFVDSFNSPAVGVYYDIGNMVSKNADVAGEIKFLGHRLFGVHIKDRKRNGGESVIIGEGDSDFPAAFSALRDIGYNGAYILQGARSDVVDDIILHRLYLDYVRRILEEVNT